jgi:hypothetical protein
MATRALLAAARERPLCGGTNFLARKSAMSVQSLYPMLGILPMPSAY